MPAQAGQVIDPPSGEMPQDINAEKPECTDVILSVTAPFADLIVANDPVRLDNEFMINCSAKLMQSTVEGSLF